MQLVLLLILLVVVEAFATGIILRRLAARHTAVWTQLGLPALSEAAIGQQWVALTKFIYSGACLRLDDVPLNVLCATLVIGEIAVLSAIATSILS